MIICLLGYMGSGKSHISKILSKKINLPWIDLDHYLSRQEGQNISEIFKKRGEIYFRHREHQALQEILFQSTPCILSLGGGTPAYYNNMDLVTEHSESFFLQASIPTLVQRLSRSRNKRPLLTHLEESQLPEYIAKHLMERNPYYQRARHRILCDSLSGEEISDIIFNLLPPLRS